MKSIFLYVSGGDYAALDFEENYDPQSVYDDMVVNNETNKVIDDEHHYIEIRIKEFDKVPSDFMSFVEHTLTDSDDRKSAKLIEVQQW